MFARNQICNSELFCLIKFSVPQGGVTDCRLIFLFFFCSYAIIAVVIRGVIATDFFAKSNGKGLRLCLLRIHIFYKLSLLCDLLNCFRLKKERQYTLNLLVVSRIYCIISNFSICLFIKLLKTNICGLKNSRKSTPGNFFLDPHLRRRKWFSNGNTITQLMSLRLEQWFNISLINYFIAYEDLWGIAFIYPSILCASAQLHEYISS